MYKLFVLAALAALVSGASIGRSPWSPTGRIIGGEDADIEDVPYQISLRIYGSHACGGSIISENWIVTAGHCAGYRSSDYGVYFGSSSRTENGTVYKVSKVIQHPNYGVTSRGIPKNDIALIKVSKAIEFSDKVQPIKLIESTEEIPEGTESVITGWGRVDDGWSLPTILQLVRIPIVTKEYCNEAYYKLGGIPENQICAAYPEGGKDACQGDSGGPLAIDGVLAGITSWGNGCALPGQPGVYTEVSSHRDWIKETTGV